MDVKYIPADWEKMRAGLSDLLGHGFGKGVFDHLKDVNEVLEDAERDIANYDVDGAISFHHTSQKSLYNSLSDDFSVLHRFTGKVGDIVDRTIDEPFYKDMDAFVQAVRDISISNYTTSNRIGAKETVQYGYGAGTTITEVPKTEVGIDDLLSGGNFYADQMKQQFEEWKVANPDEEISEDKYRMAAVNSRAFEYESIRDKQENKEFWAGIVSLVVIVGVSLVCPPAGIALGAAYGVMELSSAVSGKDWISGRELSTSERWTRGLLAPLDIIPATAAVSKFAKGARVAQLGGHVGKLGEGVRTVGTTFAAGTQRVRYLADSASNFATTRLRNATNALNDAKNIAVNKVARDLVDVGKAVDTSVTWTKNNLNLGRQAVTPDGTVYRIKETAENTHKVETNLKDFLSRFEGIILKAEGTGKVEELSRIEYLRNKYGHFTKEELNYRINLRGETLKELQKLYDTGISKKKMGPAFAGVYDKTTGKIYYANNDYDGVLPDFHPIIGSRYDSMPQEVIDSYTFTKGAGSHAEVIALNKALKANPNASLDNFVINVIRTGQNKTKSAGMMFLRCPHCAYLTDGFEIITEVKKNVK